MKINVKDYEYRELLDMLRFIDDYDFDASEASDAEWREVITEALAAGWTRNA